MSSSWGFHFVYGDMFFQQHDITLSCTGNMWSVFLSFFLLCGYSCSNMKECKLRGYILVFISGVLTTSSCPWFCCCTMFFLLTLKSSNKKCHPKKVFWYVCKINFRLFGICFNKFSFAVSGTWKCFTIFLLWMRWFFFKYISYDSKKISFFYVRYFFRSLWSMKKIIQEIILKPLPLFSHFFTGWFYFLWKKKSLREIYV